MPDTAKDLDVWRAEALELWQDGRIVNAEWIDAHIWFFEHSYADFVKVAAEMQGYNFRQKQGDWLLVVKVIQDGVPRVGFVSSADPTRCMSKLRKLLRSGELMLYEDRYA